MEKIRVWDLPTRVGHWSLVAAFAVAWLTGDSETWRLVHVYAGFIMAGVLVFRILWGLIGSRYARFSAFLFSPRQALDYLIGLLRGRSSHWIGHNPSGSYAIYALIALGFATALSGWAVYAEIGPDELEDIHEASANLMLGVTMLHVAGAVASSLLHRENLVLSMISGYKLGDPKAAIPGMKPAWLIVLFGCIAGAGWLAYLS